jgi:hypothetical protein
MTKYVIKWGNVYLANRIGVSGFHCTEHIEDALQFNSMIGAEGYAIMRVDLNLNEYKVIPVSIPESIGA